MKNRSVPRSIFLSLALSTTLLLAACSSANSATLPATTGETKPISTGPVQVRGRQLLVNGVPFQVRGVGYQPVPVGQNINGYDVYANQAIYERDFALLRAMHANTVRTWDSVTSHDFLRAAYNGGDAPVYVIMGFWVEPLSNLADPAVRASVVDDFRRYVAEFKDEPALLMWGVGNEVNMGYRGARSDWYSLLNELGKAAYEVEGAKYHPVTTANWDLLNIGQAEAGASDGDLLYLDVWGLTAYRGRSFGNLFSTYASRSTKPLLLAEFGIDAWDHRVGSEDEERQADYAGALWDEIGANSSVSIGGTLMAYSDEWWKAGDPAWHNAGGFPNPNYPDGYSDEEYYGLMAIEYQDGQADRMLPRLAYDVLRGRWASGQ